MKSCQAVILAAGRGTRLHPLTATRSKVLMPIAGKPLLVYSIENVRTAGIRDIVVVTPPDDDLIRRSIGDGSAWDCVIRYASQEEALGTAHAVACAAPLVDADDVLITFGDNITAFDLGKLVAAHRGADHIGTIVLKRVADPTRHGVVEMMQDRVASIEEKPQRPRSNLSMAGMYLFGRELFDAIAVTPPSASGEYYLPDSMRILLGRGHTIGAVECRDWRHNVNTPEEMLAVNRLLLDTEPPPTVSGGDYRVVPPVHVGRDVVVGHGSHLGPYTTLGDGCVVGCNVMLRNVILFAGVHVGDNASLVNAIVGEKAEVGAGFQCDPDAAPAVLAGDGETVTASSSQRVRLVR